MVMIRGVRFGLTIKNQDDVRIHHNIGMNMMDKKK
jgi:hypothetical protein